MLTRHAPNLRPASVAEPTGLGAGVASSPLSTVTPRAPAAVINGVFLHTQLQESSIHEVQDQLKPVISSQSTLKSRCPVGASGVADQLQPVGMLRRMGGS
jgi:hypothetical protein